ncbi:MAG: hypothetical protein VX705_10635 [Verrucomicrobiota bacterium]|nr:hypothetical protein [Verrucomicrobiota bacterium]
MGRTDHRVISSREWYYRGWHPDMREVELAPREQGTENLHRKASMVNLINLINSGRETRWSWHDQRRIRVIPAD